MTWIQLGEAVAKVIEKAAEAYRVESDPVEELEEEDGEPSEKREDRESKS